MHETIIQTGITGNKVSYYMRDLEFRGFIVENAKIFSSYVKIFLIFHVKEIVES